MQVSRIRRRKNNGRRIKHRNAERISKGESEQQRRGDSTNICSGYHSGVGLLAGIVLLFSTPRLIYLF